MRKAVWVLGLCGVVGVCQAGVNPIPKESGFSGYGALSGSYSKVNSNTLVGSEEEESRYIGSFNDQATSSGTRSLPISICATPWQRAVPSSIWVP